MTNALVLLAALTVMFSTSPAFSQSYPLTDTTGLRAHGVELVASEFGGREAVEVRMANDFEGGGGSSVALVEGAEFQNGTIEFDVASRVKEDSWFFFKWIARGFAGVAFRMDDEIERFEYIYLRPLNGRVDDPERRAHAVQYSSHPDYSFSRMRDESPGVYEAAADIGPDEWIHVKIVVAGTSARLYLNGSDEPTLVVDDLKLGANVRGGVGLWVDMGTSAHFSNLTITEAARE
jgi:hypothetical protein